MLDKDTRNAIREAFHAGRLQVRAVDPGNQKAALYPVQGVLRHCTPHKRMLRLFLEGGMSVDSTEDHSVFSKSLEGKVTPAEAGDLCKGDPVVVVSDEGVSTAPLTAFLDLPSCEFTYDLSVPGPENFVLANGILAHNSYSIGGVSLDIDKASKYESLKQNAESQFDKATEAKARTVKFLRGLQQPKYGIGIRSAFGPNVGRGVLSPRSFVVWALMSLIPLSLLAQSIPGII